MSNIVIRTVWTNEIAPEEINDFRQVVNAVFGDFCTEEFFKAKYLDNIYGPSLLFLAYADGRPVAAEALWRNDLDGKEAYQSAETCVLRDCPVKGLFGAMLRHKAAFAAAKKGAPLYCFPNNESLPGFLRMGWRPKPFFKKIFIPGVSSEKKLPPIDAKYAQWWLIRRPGICRVKRLGRYYLVGDNPQGFSRVLGRVDRETALKFPKSQRFLWRFYVDSDKPSFYNRSFRNFDLKATPRMTYYNCEEDPNVPIWRMDSIRAR